MKILERPSAQLSRDISGHGCGLANGKLRRWRARLASFGVVDCGAISQRPYTRMTRHGQGQVHLDCATFVTLEGLRLEQRIGCGAGSPHQSLGADLSITDHDDTGLHFTPRASIFFCAYLASDSLNSGKIRSRE